MASEVGRAAIFHAPVPPGKAPAAFGQYIVIMIPADGHRGAAIIHPGKFGHRQTPFCAVPIDRQDRLSGEQVDMAAPAEHFGAHLHNRGAALHFHTGNFPKAVLGKTGGKFDRILPPHRIGKARVQLTNSCVGLGKAGHQHISLF
jgi:hypothetical protein